MDSLARRESIIGIVDQALAGERDTARREMSDWLNRSVRRLRQAENVEDWTVALLDAAGGFAAGPMLFHVHGQALRGTGPHRELEVALSSAPAFASAVESADTVITIRTPDQISERIAGALSDSSGGSATKVYLFPVLERLRVVGVLLAEGDVDVAGLELLAAVASPGKARAAATREWFPDQSTLLAGELKARRFARVQVAEMRLYKAPAVESGRMHGNLYAELKNEIDSARETYRRQFGGGTSSMVDYLHLELVRTLANDDASLLGADYPGPLW